MKIKSTTITNKTNNTSTNKILFHSSITMRMKLRVEKYMTSWWAKCRNSKIRSKALLMCLRKSPTNVSTKTTVTIFTLNFRIRIIPPCKTRKSTIPNMLRPQITTIWASILLSIRSRTVTGKLLFTRNYQAKIKRKISTEVAILMKEHLRKPQ